MTATKTADAVKHGNLAAALAAVQTEIPAVAKGNTAQVSSTKGSYSYTYADLAVITPLILPLLGRNGLSFSAQPTLAGEHFVLHYSLAHESGESIEGLYPLPDPTSARPQEIGSAITYARRYALCAVTGVAPGGDDDDAAAANDKPAAARTSRASKPRQTPAPAAPEPPAVASAGWAAQILDVNTVDELRAVHAKVEEAGELGRGFAPGDARFVAEVVKLHELTPPPADVTVGQFIGAVRKAIESKPTETPTDVTEDVPAALADWDVVEIPNSGEGDE